MCKTSSYIAGIISGAAIGMAAILMLDSKPNKSRCKKAIKSTANKAVRKFSDMIDDMM